jgi:hypothetical protein
MTLNSRRRTGITASAMIEDSILRETMESSQQDRLKSRTILKESTLFQRVLMTLEMDILTLSEL